MIALEVNAGGVKMKNPVATASGTCGYGELFTASYDPARLGAVVVKGLSLLPRAGNPSPRMAETPAGMLNAIGLENVGLKVFVAEKLPWLCSRKVTVIVNVLGETVQDYCRLAHELTGAEGVHGLELNISCPNVKAGGIAFGVNGRAAAELVSQARKATPLPLWVKLSPNVSDICEIARAVEDAGADAVSLINTLRGMAIDVKKRKPVLASVFGGLSGPALKPIALRMVYEVAQAVKIPVIGLGGIASAEDAIEFILAGATAIQIGTANFLDPGTPIKVIQGIEKYLKENGMKSVAELVGGLEVN